MLPSHNILSALYKIGICTFPLAEQAECCPKERVELSDMGAQHSDLLLTSRVHPSIFRISMTFCVKLSSILHWELLLWMSCPGNKSLPVSTRVPTTLGHLLPPNHLHAAADHYHYAFLYGTEIVKQRHCHGKIQMANGIGSPTRTTAKPTTSSQQELCKCRAWDGWISRCSSLSKTKRHVQDTKPVLTSLTCRWLQDKMSFPSHKIFLFWIPHRMLLILPRCLYFTPSAKFLQSFPSFFLHKYNPH